MLHFWGLVLETDTPVTMTLDKPLHLSMATLDGLKEGRNYVRLFVTYKKESFLLGTLKKNATYQIPLNLNFEEGAELEFKLEGKGCVHLIGYLKSEELDVSSDLSSEGKENKSDKEEKSDGSDDSDEDKTDDDTNEEESSNDEGKKELDEKKENKVAGKLGKRKLSSMKENNKSMMQHPSKRFRMVVLNDRTNKDSDEDSSDDNNSVPPILNFLKRILSEQMNHHA